jgi:hypothetical protein
MVPVHGVDFVRVGRVGVVREAAGVPVYGLDAPDSRLQGLLSGDFTTAYKVGKPVSRQIAKFHKSLTEVTSDK